MTTEILKKKNSFLGFTFSNEIALTCVHNVQFSDLTLHDNNLV